MWEKGIFSKNAALIIIALFLFFYFASYSHAAVPQILSFQGRLTDASGNLLGGNGTNYYFKFDIYPSLTGGSSSWSSGSTAITIKVTQGVFNTLLGDTSAGYSALDLNFDSPAYYLEVRVDDNSDFSSPETLSPRQRIVTSGFAINAETVHGGRFLNASGVGQFGGLATVAYSRFGTDATTHAGTIDASNDLLVSGGLEVNGSAAFDGFVLFGTNASVSGVLDITKAISSAQLKVRQSSSVNAGLYVDSAGDLTLSATGGNIRQNNENLWICSAGGCGTSTPATAGNLIIERSFIFDSNSFKFKQDTASTSFQDSINTQVLIFDESAN